MNENVAALIALIAIALSIVLICKFWTACNDIRRIADKLDPEGKSRRDQRNSESKMPLEERIKKYK